MAEHTFPAISDQVTQPKIGVYADLSGDYNPLHVDVAFAEASAFGGTIAHGPIAFQSLFRALTDGLGTEALPAGTQVKVTYRAPVRPGHTVTAQLVAAEKAPASGSAFDAQCVNQEGTTVLSGTVTVPAYL